MRTAHLHVNTVSNERFVANEIEKQISTAKSYFDYVTTTKRMFFRPLVIL